MLAVSRNTGCRSFAVACSRKVQLYQWRNLEERKRSRVVDYFELVKEVVVVESPSIMTLVDCGSDGYTVCVGYRNHFDLVDTYSGKITKLHDTDTTYSKVCENVIRRLLTTQLKICFTFFFFLYDSLVMARFRLEDST